LKFENCRQGLGVNSTTFLVSNGYLVQEKANQSNYRRRYARQQENPVARAHLDLQTHRRQKYYMATTELLADRPCAGALISADPGVGSALGTRVTGYKSSGSAWRQAGVLTTRPPSISADLAQARSTG